MELQGSSSIAKSSSVIFPPARRPAHPAPHARQPLSTQAEEELRGRLEDIERSPRPPCSQRNTPLDATRFVSHLERMENKMNSDMELILSLLRPGTATALPASATAHSAHPPAPAHPRPQGDPAPSCLPNRVGPASLAPPSAALPQPRSTSYAHSLSHVPLFPSPSCPVEPGHLLRQRPMRVGAGGRTGRRSSTPSPSTRAAAAAVDRTTTAPPTPPSSPPTATSTPPTPPYSTSPGPPPPPLRTPPLPPSSDTPDPDHTSTLASACLLLPSLPLPPSRLLTPLHPHAHSPV